MYAIVDIETTGGYAARNRITEIAIYVHDGEKIVEEYQTLINPEQSIPGYITGLTGISDQMVENAPLFSEVAEEIHSMLTGKIFVAHNVHFDYSFIKREFSKVNLSLNLKKLCTVRLSRKLIPGLSSYGLGNLAKSLGIEINGRHRAGGDAEATVRIFHHLLKRDENNFIAEYLKRTSRETILPPHLDREEFESLPEETGVYYFHDKAGDVIYVGKAIDIKKRITGHFSGTGKSWSNSNIRKEIHNISYELTGNELIALLLENEEIKRLWPRYNQALKNFSTTWGIYSYTDQLGYMRLNISRVNRSVKPLISWYTHSEAWQFITEKIGEFNLCPKLSGIQKVSRECYDHQAGKCLGACGSHEAPEEYNLRVEEAIESFYQSDETFVLLARGREEGETGVVLMENGEYRGFGFIPESEQVDHFDDFTNYITQFKDNRYSRQVIQAYTLKHNYEQISRDEELIEFEAQ